MSQAEEGPPEFNFTPQTAGTTGTARYARRHKRRRSPIVLLAPILVVGAIVVAGLVALALRTLPGRSGGTIALGPVADQAVVELDTLIVDVPATVPPGSEDHVVYWLVEAPDGASIEAATGRFVWRPTEAQGPGHYSVTVGATLDTNKQVQTESRFAISVAEAPQPPIIEAPADRNAKPGEPLVVEFSARDPDLPSARIRYRLAPGSPPGATIDPETGRFAWTPDEAAGGQTHAVVVEATEAVEGGQSSQATLRVNVAAPTQPEPAPAPAMVEEKPAPETPVEVAQSPDTHGNETILGLFEKRKLFHPAEYATLRKVFAERFAMAHAEEIRSAWGDDNEAMTAWLEKHVDVKEELYRAIDPQVDNVPAALGLFHEMWKLSPERLADYGNLAIAVAVTWDQDQGVYDYAGHQKRTRSTMPADLLGAIDNYKYIIQAEKVMQGRGQFLPWEFLVHVVNHKTPVIERQWAVKGFLPERAMIGKCYSKVPYDSEMLSTQGAVTKLEGQAYTLPNLLAYGGVCAMQADFASRVGKCLGVPAAYVGGESRYGEMHAWVMWVELIDVNQKGIVFKLESHGRYRGDHYYVGNLKDPKTAEKITDRQLELRLHTIGVNPLAKRQADMIVAAYPMLREHHQMEVGDQLAFLDQLLRLCPWHEGAWRTVAGISRDGLVPKTHTKMMAGIVNSLFVTFAAFPDFTLEIFDDLIAFNDLPKKRTLLYGQLTALYERAGRPDLSCEARLRYTDRLVEDGQPKDAIRGLAASILQFADEGRFVPKMLDRLEALCGEVEGTGPELLSFYQQFLQRIPTQRGSRPSQYCMEMYERAIRQFRRHDQEPAAQRLEMQLAAFKAMGASPSQ